MNKEHDTLDKLLSERHIEPQATNLAERIIAAAKPAAIKSTSSSWWDILREVLAPRPAFALACTLAIGFILGQQAPNLDDAPAEPAIHTSDFLFYDGEVL